MTTIQDTLRSFGITRCYKGFQYAAYAIQLAVEDESRLEAITKEIYEETAEHFGCNGAAVPFIHSGEQPDARTSDARIRGASHSAFKGGRAEERAFAHHLAVTAFVVVDRSFSVRGRESAVIGVKQERTREHLCIMHKCPFARCGACSPVAIARKTGTVNSSRGGSP